MKYRIALLGTACILLGSCALYPNQSHPQPHVPPLQILIKNELPDRETQEEPPQNVKEEFARVFPPIQAEKPPVVVGCSTKFRLPVQENPPRLDLDALKKVDRNDHAKIQGILLDHIEKLHRFAQDQQKKIRKPTTGTAAFAVKRLFLFYHTT